MALVAYSDESDYTDNEEETAVTSLKLDTEEKNLNHDNTNSQDLSPTRKQNGNIHLSSNVPVSKNLTVDVKLNSELQLEYSDVVDDVPTVQTWNIKSKESTDQVFKKKEPKTKKLKLVLPALSEFDDIDEDEDVAINDDSSRKKSQPSSRGTGLFAILPKPRSTTSLVPLNVSRKKVTVPIKKKKEKQTHPTSVVDSDEEFPSTSESNDFFSLAESPSPPPEPDVNASLPSFDISHNFSKPLPEATVKTPSLPTTDQNVHLLPSNCNSADDSPMNNPSLTGGAPHSPTMNNPTSAEIDVLALRRLAGRRNVGEIPDIIDINADDALMSREEWVTRALCDEKPKRSFSKKREGNPTQQQKRKHQITYLAHQAQEREQDLQNSWGQNRFTKMQTQSKYGF